MNEQIQVLDTNIAEVFSGGTITEDLGYSTYTPFTPNQTTNIPGFKETTNFRPRYSKEQLQKKKKGVISKFFSDMSRMGMDYEDDVIANMRALPADKNLLPKEVQFANQDLFSGVGGPWKVKSNAEKNFYEKDFAIKREALRRLAVQPELEDILDTLTNESIVYDSELTYFAEPFIEMQTINDLKKGEQNRVNKSMSANFKKFYKMLNWKYNAWDDFKRFLVEGNLAWEIVYDSLDKPKEIIGIVPLDAATLTRKFDNNKWYWIQFKGITGKERMLLDAQVIYIAYQETNCISRVSYLERLVRPFNIYRIIEQAQLIWTITNASYKTKFTIPVKGMQRAMAMQTLAGAMQRYKEDIKFIGDSGELTINGQTTLPFNKEYWFPESESGSPQIETLGGEGPDLNDSDQLKYFKNQLYKISKVPLSRFDQESGESWFGSDATSVARTEIDFSRFVTRLRNTFAKIMIKPLQIQLALDIPELRDNRYLLEAIGLQYKSYNVFEELLEIELMNKRVEFIQTMKDSMVDMDTEGNEIKFFSSRFLVEKYLKLSDTDLKLNDKLKQREIDELNLAGDPDNDYGTGSVDAMKMKAQYESLDRRLTMILDKLLLEDASKSTSKDDNSKEEGSKKKKKKKSEEE